MACLSTRIFRASFALVQSPRTSRCPAPRFAHGHVRRFARPAPPVLFFVVVENSAVLYPVQLRLVDGVRLDAHRGELLFPQSYRFIVAGNFVFPPEDCDVDSARIEADRFRQKFEHPGDLFGLEVIAQTPVAEHFEERRVPVVANFLNVLRPKTPLVVGDARAQRMTLAEKIREHRLHAGSRKERRRIIFRNQTRAGDDAVPFLFAKVEVGAAEIICSEWRHAS